MTRAARNTLTLMASLVLLSGLTMAQPSTNKADKNKSSQHHSKLAKLAFWRHHKDAGNNAKAPSKHAQAKTAPKHEQIASNKGTPEWMLRAHAKDVTNSGLAEPRTLATIKRAVDALDAKAAG